MTPDTDLATLREDSALLADWAEDESSMPGVDVDNVRARIVGAVENLETELARLREEREGYKRDFLAASERVEMRERELARLREGLRAAADQLRREGYLALSERIALLADTEDGAA